MHFRTIRKGDLDACAALLAPSVARGVPPASLAALWRELLLEERISGGVGCGAGVRTGTGVRADGLRRRDIHGRLFGGSETVALSLVVRRRPSAPLGDARSARCATWQR